MKKIKFYLIILLLLSITALFAEKAPRFALLNSNDTLIFKSVLQGNLLISFWASWCQPCKKEIPHLLLLEKKYAQDKNLKLVLISVDDKKNGDPKTKARQALLDMGITSDFLQDFYHVVYKKYTNQRNVLKIPATFLVDKEGNIVFKEIGSGHNSMSKLEEAIKKLKK